MRRPRRTATAGSTLARRAVLAPGLHVAGRQAGTLAGLLSLCALLWVLTPHFLTVSNLVNVLEQTAINAIVAVGMTFVIISGGIDLSVGSVLALAGVVLGSALQAGQPGAVAVASALAVGAVAGAVNGGLVTAGRLPPFIATLGMMSMARGAALMWAAGRPISGFDEGFRTVATGRAFGIPAPVLVMAAVCLVAHVVLAHGVFGRSVYAIGGNEEAARLSGVPVRRHKIAVYALSGLTSAIAAVVLTARLDSAQPTAGVMYELDAIAATVIGGASLLGGAGSVAGSLVGALIMGVLRNGLNLLNVSSFFQQLVIGLVIITAVLVDLSLKRERA
jgi:ribose transport system permease protein